MNKLRPFKLSVVPYYPDHEEEIVKLILEHGGWKEGFNQLIMHHDCDGKKLEFANNLANTGWITIIFTKNKYLSVKRRMECRYFHNSMIKDVPDCAEVQRLSKFKFIYQGKEYQAAMISEDEIDQKLKDAKASLDYWENIKNKCKL